MGEVVYSGAKQEHWLKIAVIPDGELVQKTTGMKSMTEAATEQTALIPLTGGKDLWKYGRRFFSDKTAMVAVGGRRADSSRQKKKIILLPTVQYQKIHREAQGWEGTPPLK